jgi:hypothetical protein
VIRVKPALAAALLWLAATAGAWAQTTLPTGKGLPVQVRVAAAFVELTAFSENSGTYKATVDVRLRWEDPRLRQPMDKVGTAPRVYRGADAEAELKKIWSPPIELVNQRDKTLYRSDGLRIYPDGRVELTRRTMAEFATPFEVERFPFDTQQLRLEIAIRDLTSDAVALVYEQEDIEFSRPVASTTLDGWTLGLVNLKSEPIAGWYGASHPRVIAALEVSRKSGPVAAAIFVPLLASLLIPLLGIALNKVEDGEFQIDSFEFVNLIIGGLFAVIALNFTITSLYQVLGSGDNTITRLFTLNYVALGISLLINVAIFRFSVVERFFGRYVQEQVYFFLLWAVPLLTLAMAAIIIMVTLA